MDPAHVVHPPSIYTGGWINWTEGRYKGSTLTVSTSHGALLIAFLALFVRLAGNHLWNVICFVWFISRASGEARDGLHHQQQAILRSHWSDAFAAWQHLRLGWHWRAVIGRRRAILRSIPFTILALVHAALFLVAGIFSGRVAGTVSDVLLNSVSCGQFPFPSWGNLGSTAEDAMTFSAISARVQRNHDIASDWSASCHSSSTLNTTWIDCAPLGRSRIHWTTKEIPCPFSDGMCTAQAVQFDTGLVDSHLQFGINAPHHDRIAYRRVAECSPVTTQGYRRDNIPSATSDIPERFREPYDASEMFTGFFYGASSELSSPGTFYISNRSYPGNRVDTNADVLPYELSIQAFPSYGNVSARPIAALDKANASTTLLFLLNKAKYFAPVDDPWFNATTPSSQQLTFPDGTLTENVTLYSNPDLVSVVACTESWQWCNQASDQCSQLTAQRPGLSDSEVQALGLNTRQSQTLTRVEGAADPTYLAPLVTFLGAESLLAARSAAFCSLPLPDHQWIHEIDHWFGTGLTSMQLNILQYVAGDSDAVDYLYKVPPSPDESWMCTNQIIQRTDYTSFSVLALVLIIVLGSLIMLISWFLWECLPRTKTFGPTEKGLHWKFNDMLHLQSRVFEMRGLGKQWQREDSIIPTTSARSAFRVPVTVFSVIETDKGDLSRTPSSAYHTQRSRSHSRSRRNLMDSTHEDIHDLDNVNAADEDDVDVDVDIDPRHHEDATSAYGADTDGYGDADVESNDGELSARTMFPYEIGRAISRPDAANNTTRRYTYDQHGYRMI